MVCDEVMAGFGRTGEWFAVNHWNVVPDLMTMAKGLTSAYLPLGAVGMRRPIADHFPRQGVSGGLTYNSHPMACAAALATIAVYEEDDLIGNARRLGAVMTDLLTDLARRHSIVGAHRNIGLFGIVELVRDQKTKTPLAPFGGTSPEMKRLGALFRELGLYTFVRWHNFFYESAVVYHRGGIERGFGLIDSALTQLERSM
jgi:taurine--2-oxoglutarate transaminase